MLIILYGDFSDKNIPKHQIIIDGKCTCGYREYAKHYGCIIYLSKQKVKQNWEYSINDPKKVVSFISKYPGAIVWSVKHSVKKDKEILSKIKNRKVYYSCNSKNMYNPHCDVSLVDTNERVRKGAKLWFKGKDPNYWKPNNEKRKFDYLLMGRRADKNELFFLKNLNAIKEKRNVLWVGGLKHKKKIVCNHNVVCTDFISQRETRNNICKAKVGILFTELDVEGFPQSFLEMTMCGLPVVYNINAPRNDFYFHKYNNILCYKNDIITAAESLLEIRDPEKCRNVSIKNYSLNKSYRRILECIKS